MQSNPVAWRIYGVSITLAGGRLFAFIIFLMDLAVVLWRLQVNDGLSDSGGWGLLWADLKTPAKGWGAYIYISLMLMTLIRAVLGLFGARRRGV